MNKYFSREFLLTLALLAVSTVAMFTRIASFTEWVIGCGSFIGVYTTGKTIQKSNGKRD